MGVSACPWSWLSVKSTGDLAPRFRPSQLSPPPLRRVGGGFLALRAPGADGAGLALRCAAAASNGMCAPLTRQCPIPQVTMAQPDLRRQDLGDELRLTANARFGKHAFQIHTCCGGRDVQVSGGLLQGIALNHPLADFGLGRSETE